MIRYYLFLKSRRYDITKFSNYHDRSTTQRYDWGVMIGMALSVRNEISQSESLIILIKRIGDRYATVTRGYARTNYATG